MRKVVGYIRVSTDRQAESGLSLEAQRAKLGAYCVAHDLALVRVEVDAASAKSLARPALQRALASLVGNEADGLLIAKLDRLTRRVRDLGQLLDEHFAGGKSLLSVADHIDTASPSGRLVLNVLMSVAQWEREECSARTATALAAKKARGEVLGRAPFGWRWQDGAHVPHEAEQATRARAAELRAAGEKLEVVALTLNAEGRMPRAGQWTAPKVCELLKGAVAP